MKIPSTCHCRITKLAVLIKSSDLYILGLYGDRAALMISPQVSVYSDLYILGLYGDRAALMISPQVSVYLAIVICWFSLC